MKLAVIPGDGIGVEVTAEALKVLGKLVPDLETTEYDLGNLAVAFHEMHLQALPKIIWQFIKIPTVGLRQDQFTDFLPLCRHDLFPDPAYGKNPAGQSQFPGHGQGPADLPSKRQ